MTKVISIILSIASLIVVIATFAITTQLNLSGSIQYMSLFSKCTQVWFMVNFGLASVTTIYAVTPESFATEGGFIAQCDQGRLTRLSCGIITLSSALMVLVA